MTPEDRRRKTGPGAALRLALKMKGGGQGFPCSFLWGWLLNAARGKETESFPEPSRKEHGL